MTPAYFAKLGFINWKTDVDAQKIDSLALVTYEMVIAGFLLQDNLKKAWFFKKEFLLADTSIEIVFKMHFLAFSKADVWFAVQELVWRSYTAIEALLIIQRVKLISQ